MPRLTQVGEVPVSWCRVSGRYVSPSRDELAAVFNRLRPVPDPIFVTVGPAARPGGNQPWEGDDPQTGRRYVARKAKDAPTVVLQEVLDA